jgi:hypothetical protein
VERFSAPEDFRGFFKAKYGPIIVTYRSIADDPERVAERDRALDDLARRHLGVNQPGVMDWEYLLFTATKSPGRAS